MDKLPVVEIFGPTLQGEGYLAGRRSMFVRLGFCDGAVGGKSWCQWCDSMHAVDPKNKHKWEYLTPFEIRHKLWELSPSCRLVTISGGNPALYDLSDLVHELDSYGSFSLAVETQGTLWRKWMADLDVIVVSPKPPTAGAEPEQVLGQFAYWLEQMGEDCNEPNIHDRIPTLSVKVPLGSLEDYEFAKRAFRLANNATAEYQHVDFSFSMVTHPEDTTESLLADWRKWASLINKDKELHCDARLLPQLHVVLWGHKLGV